MEVLFVRHAIAEERDSGKWPDDRGRPLTRAGVRRFRSVAQSLSNVWAIPDIVLASPLARAWQTASLLEDECGWPEAEECAALEPGRKPTEALAALKRTEAEQVVLVGHEPSMHELLSYLLTGSAESLSTELKKGGPALIRFDGPVRAGGACLIWLLPPRVILSLAGE